jgi:NitT/TauT family transport system permease protein
MQVVDEPRTSSRLDAELSGLDNLELAGDAPPSLLRRAWSALWPKLAAVGLGLLLWQLVVWSHWKPEYLLPGPTTVLPDLWHRIQDGSLVSATVETLSRGVKGYLIALVIGIAMGSVMAQVKVLRVAFGSLVTGLQTMPSIAWFPLAIVLFHLSETAIIFVVVVGSAPSIANGLLTGVDNIPPLMLRAGRVLGASRWQTYRRIILPASLPSFIGGMKQGWAFSWRSLLAGELLVQIGGQTSLGRALDIERNLLDMSGLLAIMLAVLIVGSVIDAAVFGTMERAIRRRWGLLAS